MVVSWEHEEAGERRNKRRKGYLLVGGDGAGEQEGN